MQMPAWEPLRRTSPENIGRAVKLLEILFAKREDTNHRALGPSGLVDFSLEAKESPWEAEVHN